MLILFHLVLPLNLFKWVTLRRNERKILRGSRCQNIPIIQWCVGDNRLSLSLPRYIVHSCVCHHLFLSFSSKICRDSWSFHPLLKATLKLMFTIHAHALLKEMLCLHFYWINRLKLLFVAISKISQRVILAKFIF